VKLSEDSARVLARIARDAGMFDSQVYRLILERGAVLGKAWNPDTNFKRFCQQMCIGGDQLSLFSLADDGNQQKRRKS
jgi:hypothetical protein